jgi:hypothetical protein
MIVIQVGELTTPVTGSREPRWKDRTAAWVCGPKNPVTGRTWNP